VFVTPRIYGQLLDVSLPDIGDFKHRVLHARINFTVLQQLLASWIGQFTNVVLPAIRILKMLVHGLAMVCFLIIQH
jgi:hypothetical protein